MTVIEPLEDKARQPGVRGFIHRPEISNNMGLVLTHGAGGDSTSPILRALADTFSEAGYTVLRCDLPFRQRRTHGAPLGSSAEDREGLRNAVRVMRGLVSTVFLGGHSYGGRQASMLVAEEAQIVEGLLLLSYPLHPPRNPSQLRTAHFPSLRAPALFVHGARDPFGTLSEMEAALKFLAGQTRRLAIEGVGH